MIMLVYLIVMTGYILQFMKPQLEILILHYLKIQSILLRT